MKFAVFGFICVISIAATCLLYGWLESSMNMIQGLGQFFQPGAGTIVFSPFLLLFIALGLAVFVGITLLAVTAAAFLGGAILRSRSLRVSRSFARRFLFVAVICHFVLILVAIEQNAGFLLHRPRLHPNIYLASVAAAVIAALNLFVAAFIIRKQTAIVSPNV